MSIAEKEKFSDYASFNEFFIRPLKKNARPINQKSNRTLLPYGWPCKVNGDTLTMTAYYKPKVTSSA